MNIVNIDNCQIYDVSPLISVKTAVFPGDTPFSRQIALDLHSGHNLTLSSYAFSAHIGAHADAPNHYHLNGESIDQRSLHYYLGKAQVIHIDTQRGERLNPSHFKNKKLIAPRILIATGSFPDPDHWNHDFCALSPELVNYFAENQVILIGIDTPSVDLADDKELLSHHAIYKNNMAILEGLVLNSVPEGVYTLIALPLKIAQGDSSPVRALLLKENS